MLIRAGTNLSCNEREFNIVERPDLSDLETADQSKKDDTGDSSPGAAAGASAPKYYSSPGSCPSNHVLVEVADTKSPVLLGVHESQQDEVSLLSVQFSHPPAQGDRDQARQYSVWRPDASTSPLRRTGPTSELVTDVQSHRIKLVNGDNFTDDYSRYLAASALGSAELDQRLAPMLVPGTASIQVASADSMGIADSTKPARYYEMGSKTRAEGSGWLSCRLVAVTISDLHALWAARRITLGAIGAFA